MTVSGILHSVFPPPRRRLRGRDWLPLIAFLAIFGGVCLTLDLAGLVVFVRPEAFILTIVTVWLWWVFLAGVTGLSPARSHAALWIRFIMAAGFIVILAEPRAVRTSEVLSVIYAVDVSDSVGQQAVDSALEFVARQVSEKPAADEAGLVLFGAEAVVELPPRITFPFDGVVTSEIRRDATDLAEALSLSAAMIPSRNNGRIVLISDGTSNEGDLNRRLNELQARGIAVDVLPVNYEYQHEVWVERLELPQHVKLSQDYEASITVSSIDETSGTLFLRENGRTLASSNVTLRPGLNQFSLPIRVDQPGYYEYEAAIEVPNGKDNLPQNNVAENFLFVQGTGQVLIVTAPGGDPREWQPLADSISRSGRIVDQKDAYGLPDSTLALMPYDCVVFLNVPMSDLIPAQMNALRSAVRDAGTGFLMVGGPNSFGPGGYHHSPIEDLLPVSMDTTQNDLVEKAALVIILHTCEFKEGDTWGKRITNQAIRVLSSHDEVGVLVYDDGGKMSRRIDWQSNESSEGDRQSESGQGGEDDGNPFGSTERWLFRLTPAVQIARLTTLVNGANIGDMPTFTTTMEMGLAGLAGSDATVQRMLIISDGDPSAPTDELLARFQNSGIRISTVTVFPHGDSDRAQMQRIADATNGTSYNPKNATELPGIFITEARRLKTSMIQNETFTPQSGLPSTLQEQFTNPPLLHGYTLTTLKPNAEPVLLSQPNSQTTEGANLPPSPVLARWKFGLGTTAAFTSDLTTKWGRDWVQWERFDSVVSQLISSLSRTNKPAQLRLWTHIAGSEAVVVAEDFATESENADDGFSDLIAVVNGPDDFSEKLRLQQVSPRRYEARLPLPGQGKYQVIAQGSGNGRTETVTGGFIVSYSPEYLRFRSDTIMLEQIRERTNGQFLERNSPASAVFGERQPKSSSRLIFDWLLISLAILLPLDVAVRRIHIDWVFLKNMLTRGNESSQQPTTLGALLATKQETEAQIESTRNKVSTNQSDQVSKSPRTVTAQPGGDPQHAASRKTPTESNNPHDNESTTLSKLLAIKRQQEQDAEESGTDTRSDGNS